MAALALSEAVQRAVAAIRSAEALIITAGAGLGCDSGLPAFRTVDGFWRAYPPMKKLNLHFQEMSNPEWFRRDPSLAWGFFGHRLYLYKNATPHDGFRILRDVGARMRKGHFVVTSNVDGQFQKAEFSEDRILEVHGSIHHWQCTDAYGSDKCNGHIYPAPDAPIVVSEDTFRADTPLPLCPKCGTNLARPNILMFNDMLWLEDRTCAQEERFDAFLKQVGAAPLVVIELGAGKSVITIRRKSERLVREHRGPSTLIRINTDDADIETYGAHQVSLPLGALDGLTRIEQGLADTAS